MYKFSSSKKLILIISLAILMITLYAGMLWAGGAKAGSAADPLVTKSFVEKYVHENLSKGSESSQWDVKVIQPGDSFLGGAGTEVVLRSGEAIGVDPTGNGILDITNGGNVVDGQQIPANHLLVIPREDGRGLKAETEVVIMYKGSDAITER